MLLDDTAECRIVADGLLYVYLCFLITFLLKEDPCVGIEEGTVGRLCLDGLVAHLLRLRKIPVLHTEVIGIVVQCRRIVRFPLQTAVVSLESLIVESFLVEDVAHDGVEV